MTNNISPELLAAYSNTKFIIYNPYIEIKVNTLNIELDKLLLDNKVQNWAFITSQNPFSEILSMEENTKFYNELKNYVSDFIFFEGEGIGEDENWAPEKSLLIIGLDEVQAIEIGKRFNQNAIVVGEINKPPVLKIIDY